jgi:DNA-binding CsgD family transcriptional regulator
MRDEQQFNDLVNQLYESVLEPGRLASTLKNVDQYLDSDLCHLVGWKSGTDNTLLSLMTNANMDTAQETYADYYCQIDPRRKLAQQKPVGELFACSDYFDSSYAKKSEFYNDFLYSFNARYVIGGCLIRDASHEVCIVFNHNLGRNTFSSDQRLMVNRLLPHLRNSIKLMLHASPLRAGIFAGEHGLDAIDQGVIVLDRDGLIDFTNAKAETILNNKNCLVTNGKKLEATWGQHKELENVLSRVRMSRQAESLMLTSVNIKTNHYQKYFLTVLAPTKDGYQGYKSQTGLGVLGDEQAEVDPKNKISFNIFPNADLLILISSPEKQAVVTGRQLMQLFGLSAAEARLGHSIARGLTVEEHADLACVSIATVRTHLRAILAKTGERRLQDLIRVFANIPSAS